MTSRVSCASYASRVLAVTRNLSRNDKDSYRHFSLQVVNRLPPLYLIRIHCLLDLVCYVAAYELLSITQESHVCQEILKQKMTTLRKFFSIRTQEGTPVAHSPYNILDECTALWGKPN